MSAQWKGQSASRLDRTPVTNLNGASQVSTYFGSQTYQIRIQSNLPVWCTIGSSAVVTANSSAALIPGNAPPEYFTVSTGMCASFITTSTSTTAFAADLRDFAQAESHLLHERRRNHALAAWLNGKPYAACLLEDHFLQQIVRNNHESVERNCCRP